MSKKLTKDFLELDLDGYVLLLAELQNLREVKDECVEALEMAQISNQETIHRTQTGDRRNRLTEENILIIKALTNAKTL